jgi:hypothetical protein
MLISCCYDMQPVNCSASAAASHLHHTMQPVCTTELNVSIALLDCVVDNTQQG